MLVTPIGMILDVPLSNLKGVMLGFSIDKEVENKKSHDKDGDGSFPILPSHILQKI